MDLKSTIDIILKDLKEARNILDDLKNYPEVPAIQVELAKAKCRSAEEVLKFLGEEASDAMPPSPQQKPLSPETDRLEEQGSKEDPATINDPGDHSSDNKDQVDTGYSVEALELEEEADKKAKEEIIDQIIEPKSRDEQLESPAKNTGSGKILADKFSKESSINEQIASSRHKGEKTEVSKLKALGDLSEAIGINDRFQFVRELFNGNQEEYKETLARLNNVTSIDDAFDILSGASSAGKDSESFDQLLELVKRKLRTV